MRTPLEVFEDPTKYWDFLTLENDSQFEGQFFDRKEAGRPDPQEGIVLQSTVRNLKGQVQKSVSAFANTNPEGGLLVLGIGATGVVFGTRHLREAQRNDLTNIDQMLVGQTAQLHAVQCTNHTNAADEIIVIYVPPSEREICRTPGRRERAWMRRGAQNFEMTDEQRDRVKRDKGIVSFERTPCVPYALEELDKGVLDEFRHSVVPEGHQLTDEEVLYQKGALTKVQGELWFTNAGFLFFAANPQRVFPKAVVRLLRFSADSTDKDRGLPTHDDIFDGPITTQIRNLRTFRDQSGFFKVYQRRRPEGGFVDEPEYPPEAVDEAIVNAIAHRDYAHRVWIELEYYRDALLTRNPGRLLQRDDDIPEEFSLDTVSLVSTPRNELLTNWLRGMRDAAGGLYMRELAEGTRTMLRVMLDLALPPPTYRVTETQTSVRLFSNAREREAAIRATEAVASAERFANLFPLVSGESDENDRPLDHSQRKHFLQALGERVVEQGWYIDRLAYGKLEVHRRAQEIALPDEVRRHLRIYPGYTVQVREYFDRQYLCADYRVQVKNVRTLAELSSELEPDAYVRRTTAVNWEGWHRGRILKTDGEWATVALFDFDQDVDVLASDVIPDLPVRLLKELMILVSRHACSVVI